MKVALVTPPQYFTSSQVTAGVVPPLGAMYVAGYIRRHGINVALIDGLGGNPGQYFEHKGIMLRGLTFDEMLERIPADADIIGISSLYSFSHLVVKELAELVRKRFPGKPIVLGGVHPTVLPEFVIKDIPVDFLVLHEGEETFLELCQTQDNPRNIRGIVYQRDGKVVINEPRPLIKDLDSIPFPAYDLINMHNYFATNEPHGCSRSGKWMTVLSSRGCTYKCTFCSTPHLWHGRWRVRSVGNMMAEMDFLNTTYGVTDFHFEDENMGLNKKWLNEFTETLISRNKGYTWQPSNGLRAENLDYGLLVKMKKSGCSLVVITLESASERVRNEIIKKQMELESVGRAMQNARKAGLRTTCYFIIGLPGESKAEARQTVNYACHLARKGLDECVIGVFALLPGSELFRAFQKDGKLTLDDAYFRELLAMGDLSISKSWNDDISGDALRKLRFHGYLRFHMVKALFHPFMVIRSAFNILSGSIEIKSERVLRSFIKRFFSGLWPLR